MIYQDVHNHTMWSDGSSTVEEVVNRAREHKLKVIGISDHYELLSDELAYRLQLDSFKKRFLDITILVGIEIRTVTLLNMTELDFKGLSQYDYILIEDIEYQTNIPVLLKKLKGVIDKLTCKIGIAHLDLGRLGDYRGEVIEFMNENDLFLDFNFEAIFYVNLMQECEQIEDVLTKGVEIRIGSDTHDMESDWWSWMVAAHQYLLKHQKRIGNSEE